MATTKYPPELYHHGTLGMKWGVRRYQNKDGSLTPLGKKRAQKLEEQYLKVTGNDIKVNAKRNKPVSEMSDEELADVVRRTAMERTYAVDRKLIEESNAAVAKLHPKKLTAGQKFGKFLAKDIGGDVILPSAKTAAKNNLTKYLDTLLAGGLKEVKKVMDEPEEKVKKEYKKAKAQAKEKDDKEKEKKDKREEVKSEVYGEGTSKRKERAKTSDHTVFTFGSEAYRDISDEPIRTYNSAYTNEYLLRYGDRYLLG